MGGEEAMEPRIRDDDPSSVAARRSGFLSGVALALLVSAALTSNPAVDRWLDKGTPVPPVPGIAVSSALFVVVFVWSLRVRNRLATLLVISFVPTAVAGAAIRLSDPNPSWAEPLRAVGLALTIAVAFVTSLSYARQKRELERAIFDEATVAAFFATLIAAGIYGVLGTAFHLPPVSLIWVPVFADVAWIVGLFVFERRYA
jgi:hypothetical protein